MVRTEEAPLRVGERMPDVELHGPDGRPVRLHDLIDDSFVALYFTDVRRRPPIPSDMPELVRPIGIIHRRQKLLTPTAQTLLEFLQSEKG